MSYLLYGLLLIPTYMVYKYFNRKKPKDTVDVPTVKNKYPIVGHGIEFSKDIIGFIRKSYNEYGKIFKIKLFRKNMVLICDRQLAIECFKANENNLSMYKILDDIYFADALCDDPKLFPTILSLVKSSIVIKHDIFYERLFNEARNMVTRLNNNKGNIDIITEMSRYAAYSSSQCFFDMPMSDEFFDILLKFSHLLNKVVKTTYLIPKWTLNLIYRRELRKYRRQMTDILGVEIQKYINDSNKIDSMVFRKCADYVFETGTKLTKEQIGDVVISMLYVSAENTAMAITSTLIDLARHPHYWDRVRDESLIYLNNDDKKGLYASELLENCIMESARMNTHIFPISRKPVDKNLVLGNKYYVGDTDVVAICEPMLMVYESDIFKDALKYYPERYTGPNKEKKGSGQIMTWGLGTHLCPGKNFALFEIKTIIAFITTNFERFDINNNNLKPLDYFSVSVFAERKTTTKFKKLNN